MPDPEVSVVVATRNREMRLRFLLEALVGQTLAADRFEVVVVRAEDTTGPLTVAPEGLEVRFLDCPPGPAAQRNVGWRAACAELVVFTDDDCRPTPGWLQSLLAARDGSGAILQGRTLPDPDEEHLLHGQARSITITEPNEWFPTCNIAYPREVLERIGGFDEAFPTAWGEDTDLGFRALELGAEHRFVEGALNYHAVHPRRLPDAVRESLRRDSLPMVVARNPGARRLLYLGVFVQPSHGRVLLFLAGVLIAHRAPMLGALAMAPYVRRHRRHLRPLRTAVPRMLFDLPGQALVDAASTFACARASLKNRILVL